MKSSLLFNAWLMGR